MVVISLVFCHKKRCLGRSGWCENGSSRCGSVLHFSNHGEVSNRNPVGSLLVQVVVDSIDNDRHWMRQCSAELEVKVELPLTQ